MSGLINRLLETHYENISVPRVKPYAELPIKELGVKQKIVDVQFNQNLKYCKNGHAIDDRGRCFGKGCKYN